MIRRPPRSTLSSSSAASDVYKRQVFSSWGALIWLGDLERWAQVIAHFLKPGGTFYLAEFHPYAFLLADDAAPESLRIGYPYFQYGRPQRFDEPGDYADPEAKTRHT